MRRNLLLLLLGLLLLSDFAGSNLSPEPISPPPEELSTQEFQKRHPGYWREVKDLVFRTLTGVSQVRELSPPEEISCRVVTADWAGERWGKEYVRENSQKIAITERIWKSLFLLPREINLADIYAEWPRSYLMVKSEGKLYFILENFSQLDGRELRKALAHEVVHFLQEEHFRTPERATFDGEKAWSALVEGDADFTRTKYLERIAPELAPEIKPLPPLSTPTSSAPQMPPAVAQLFRFPYDFGEAFVAALYRRGGWQQVNQAYSHPPETTEQILHPEKYFLDEGAEQIRPLPLDITGWRRGRADQLGEYFIRVLLETQLPPERAEEAAQGWGGDRLTYYQTPESYLFTWQLRWDSRDEAVQFHKAWAEFLYQRGARALGPHLWFALEEYFWESLRGREALVIVSKDQGLVRSALAYLPRHRLIN